MYTDPDAFIGDWRHSLINGAYTQTFDALKTDQGFCCLGVADDLSGAGEWRANPDDEGYIYYEDGDNEASDGNEVTRSLRRLLGLNERTGIVLIPKDIVENYVNLDNHGWLKRDADDTGSVDLARINDAGVPFTTIAKIIGDWWARKRERA